MEHSRTPIVRLEFVSYARVPDTFLKDHILPAPTTTANRPVLIIEHERLQDVVIYTGIKDKVRGRVKEMLGLKVKIEFLEKWLLITRKTHITAMYEKS
jgi:hypothetical protein